MTSSNSFASSATCRVVVSVVLAMAFAAACIHTGWSQAHRGPDTDPRWFAWLDQHHVRWGWTAGHCHVGLFPRPDGQCDASEFHRGADGGGTVRTATVACGGSIELCGERFECDCSAPIAETPCGRDLHPLARTLADGAPPYRLAPPRNGGCAVLPAPGWLQLIATAVPYGEAVPFDRDVHCRCADFAPIASATDAG